MEGGPELEWEEMIEEFRALGGIAENVRLGTGTRGRGLFPKDPFRDSRIVVPRHLLISTEHVMLDRDRLAIRPEAPLDPKVRSFFERFEEKFSFSAGAAEECRKALIALHELPETVQSYLRSGEGTNSRPYPAPTDDLVLRRFLTTRSIFGGKLMPVLELANHSSVHEGFDTSSPEGAIEVSGRFDEEILVRYSRKDTWRMFAMYGFVCPVPIAYSIAIECEVRGQRLRVEGDYRNTQRIDGVLAPTVEREGDMLVFSHLVLGSRQDPGIPKWLFFRLMREHGVGSPEEFFDVIAFLNRSWFFGLLTRLEDHDGPMITDLRKAARLQLETLSFCIGAQPTRRK